MKMSPEDAALVAASGLFDPDWYVAHHRQAVECADALAAYLGAPFEHDPGPGFSSRHYLLANPDVAAAGIHPLLHYLRYGQAEGRLRFPVGSPMPASASMPRDSERIEREYSLIRATALFDAEYYLSTYADVHKAGIDPLRHFVEHGANEGRLPNPFFDTRHYQSRQMEADEETNPLAHYLMSPQHAACSTSSRFDGAYYCARYPDVAGSGLTPLDHFLRHGLALGRSARFPSPGEPASASVPDLREIRCTVVVPVHDAAAAVAECLDALLRNTRFGHGDRLLVIDDASTTHDIAPLLASLEGKDGVTVVRQGTNLGYTRTVNRGIAMAGDDDVVLLNSDTVVGPHWLRRLKATASSGQRVGTVTAVSNAAGEFSVPLPGNHIAPDAPADDVARAVEDAAAAPFAVPTGNGFCLYLRRAMLAETGGFDEAGFPEGYGEENDLCMRAVALGWTHLVDPAVYVRHRRSASFGDRRQALAEAGYGRVCERHPDYEPNIRAIGQAPGFIEGRYRIAHQFSRLASGGYRARPRVLYVISTRVGGTPQTNADLMRAIAGDFDSLALASDAAVLELLRAGARGYELVDRIALAEPLRFAGHASLEYDQVLRALLLRLGVDVLHIRHLAWHGLGLVEAARSLGIPVVMSFHDYYCVCPTVNLLDEQGVLHRRGVPERAPNPLWHLDPTALPMTPERLARWQQRMQSALAGASAFVTTSPAARTLISEALPVIGARADDFHVIPHGRDFDRFLASPAAEACGPGRPLRVLLPGNISAHKGAGLVREVKDADTEGRFEFHLLGSCPPELLGRVVEHGPYAREDFAAHVEAIRPDIAAVLSVWPETYCHTLTECWAAGLAVVGVDIGAVGERIREQGGGWLLGYPAEASDLRSLLYHLAQDTRDRMQRADEISRWQAGLPGRDDTATMAGHYRRLYRRIMASS